MTFLDFFLGFLPFGGLLLTVFSFRKTAACPFDALMRGSLIWAVTLVMASNVLSGMTLLSFPCIFAYWAAYLLFFAVRAFRATPLHIAWPKPDRHVYAMTCVALLTLAAALVYPPTHFDTMTYHLPRVMHWWQNSSLEHYYTSIIRQTCLSPFAELVIFHSVMLSGTDYPANLVEWSAFIGSMCTVAATASLLGAGKTGQVLAALFFATLPMAIALASGTQTSDLTVGFWLSCVAARFIIWKNEATASNAIYFGTAVGLAILAKGTAYLISFPFVLAFAYISIKKYKQSLLKGIIAGIIAACIFMPHVYRNYITYNDPIPNIELGSRRTILFPPTVQAFIAVTCAHILSNIPIPFIRFRLDQAYEALLTTLDIDPNDKAIFPYGPVSKGRKHFSTHYSTAQNPVHVILLIWCLSGIGIHYAVAASRYRWYVLASVSMYCLLMSWNYWSLHYQPPLFALAAPLAGIALEQACGVKTRNIFGVLLMLYCIPVLLGNWSRPLLPPAFGTNPFSVWTRSREELYFTERHKDPHFYDRYVIATDMLAKEKAGSIGLVLSENAWEYPLWVLLKARVPEMPEIRHVVPPETADGLPTTPQPFAPHYLFVLERRLAWEKQDETTDDMVNPTVLWRAWAENQEEIKPPLRLFKRVNGMYERIF